MKKLLLPIFLISSISFCYAEIDMEKAMKFADKYKLNDINTNQADVNYAKKYEDIANDKVAEKYNNLGSKSVDVNNYKDLGKIQKQVTEKYQKLDEYNKSPSSEERFKRQSATDVPKVTNKIIKSTQKTQKQTNENSIFVDESPDMEIDDAEEIVIVNDEDEKKINELRKQEKQEKEQISNQLDNLKYQTKLLSKNKKISKKLDEIIEKNKEFDETQLTAFFFVSSDMEVSNFNDFILSIEKLKRLGYNIVGRVLFRGLINDTLDGIPNWFKKSEKKGLKRSPIIKYQFHPWAFKYFSLDKVPAFALSKCKKDFRFKTCDHKFLIKGNMTFKNFLETIAEYHSEYNKVLHDLVEVEQ